MFKKLKFENLDKVSKLAPIFFMLGTIFGLCYIALN